MNAALRATAKVHLGCAAILCGAVATASGATIHWHTIGRGSPPQTFIVNPAAPTTTNIISFIAPTEGQIYANSCWASVAKGDPSIAIDSTNQTINVTFSPPRTNTVCPAYVLPVSGVDGEFGPIKPGLWTFNILQSSYAFTVSEAPILLSVEALANSHSLLISWPVSGEAFALEFNGDLSSDNWQVVTNNAVMSSNLVTVQVDSASGTRFFRLHRLGL